jgi:23S rRNA pseudoU1915 N3-methylase RlmH
MNRNNNFFNPEDKLSELHKEKMEEEEKKLNNVTMDDLRKISIEIKGKERETEELVSKFEKIKAYLIDRKIRELNDLKGLKF